MAEYGFRLRFNLAPTVRINSDKEEIELLALPGGERLRLRTAITGTKIKDNARASLLGGPFTSAALARVAAERAKYVLLYWAVERRVGIDFGDGHPRGTITEAGLEFFRQELGAAVRFDLHGIDVYELIPDLRFIAIEANAQVGIVTTSLLEVFGREFSSASQLTAKQLLAVEVYSGSFFDVSPRSRFITLVTAVEALLDPALRPQKVQALVGSMEDLVNTSDVDKVTKRSITSSLQWLRSDSIGQAGRSLAERLLPGNTYDGRSASSFFAYSYNVRSELVHQGHTDPSINILSLANAMEEFVANLLIASIQDLK
jgi:hypothetical protein